MTDDVTAYPLAWPIGRPRSKYRTRAKFGAETATDFGSRKASLSMAQALDRLRLELSRLGASKVVISTHVELRLDGLPYSNRKEPSDPGAAVYFELNREPHCLSCDRWDRVPDNLAAIAAHIAAVRGQLRWGVGDLRTVFAGFKALPAPAPWWRVLDLPGPSVSPDLVKERFRAMAIVHHPDKGGSGERMAEISAAYEQGLAAVGAG